jgi:hypothetical protein
MKAWDLVGIPGGLWSLKQAFDLFKDKLFLGGCPQGFFRMFATRKSKCQLTEKLHEYCIDQVLVSNSGLIMTKDVSGIIKLSIIEDVHSKLHLKTLLSIHQMFDEHFRFLKFPIEQPQLFYYVIPYDYHFQLKVFDSLNNAKLLVDFDIPREKQKMQVNESQREVAYAQLKFLDLSFGFLNAVLSVQYCKETGQYFLSTYSFEGVRLTQFTLVLNHDNKLRGFQLFKDSYFKDYLAAISQKGIIKIYLIYKVIFISSTCLSSKMLRRFRRK